MSSQLLNYSLGLDCSSDDFKVCFLNFDTEQTYKVKGSRKFDNRPGCFKELVDWTEKRRKDKSVPLRITMEVTGVYHERLAYYLHETGYEISIVAPNKAKHYLRSLGHKTKTDKMDALGLARMGAEQRLEKWQPSSKQMLKLKRMTRHRAALQKQITMTSNQLHALNRAAGDNQEVMDMKRALLDFLRQQVKQTDKQLEAILAQDEQVSQKVRAIAASLDGVGELTVMSLVAETDGFKHFSSEAQLTSYCGYDVVANQSGKTNGKTKISKQGNTHIRRALFMPAFNVVRYETGKFPALYERVHQRTKIKMKGYVAVQRKLLCLIYTLWKNDTVFEENYGEAQSQDVQQEQTADLNIGQCRAGAPLSGVAA